MTLISIITPVWNRDFCIKRAIDEVKALTVPKGIDYEHIVVDDGSTDKTSEIIKKNKHKKLKFIGYSENKGVTAARQAALDIAKGEYILFYDSDDEILPDTLEKINDALDKTKKEFKVYRFMTKNISTDKLMCKIKMPYINIDFETKLSGKGGFGEFMTMASKEVFDSIRYDQEMYAFEIMFWHKVSKKFNSEVFIPVVTRLYHDEYDDRLCKKLVDPKYAAKRLADYKLYIEEFEGDLRRFGLRKKLKSLYRTMGFYAMLARKKKFARIMFRRSLPSIAGFGALILSYLGTWVFKIIAYTVKRFA